MGYVPYRTSLERVLYDRAYQKGRQEVQEEMTLRALRHNLPLDVIAQATGYTIEELQKLQEKLNNQN